MEFRFFMGLLDTIVQMTIILGHHKDRIKIVALDSLGDSYPWETSLHVSVDGALWTSSGAEDHGSHN